MIIINSDVTTITLDVEFSSQEGSDLLAGRGTSIIGFDYHFIYGQKNSFRYDTVLATFSEGRLINEWWENNETLTLTDTELNVSTVQIFNTQNPFSSFQNQPYQDFYNQSLEFVEI